MVVTRAQAVPFFRRKEDICETSWPVSAYRVRGCEPALLLDSVCQCGDRHRRPATNRGERGAVGLWPLGGPCYSLQLKLSELGNRPASLVEARVIKYFDWAPRPARVHTCC